MKKILLYGLHDIEADLYQNAAEEMGIAMYSIGDDALDMKINDAFDIVDDLDSRHEEFSDHYMLFHGFELKEIIGTLKEFTKRGLNFQGINVMRTDLNEEWTLRRLMQAAAREHYASLKAIELQDVLTSCNGRNLSQLDDKQQREFKNLVKEGIALLQKRRLTDGEADRVMEELRTYLAKTERMLS